MITTTTTRNRVRVPRAQSFPMLVTRGIHDQDTALKEHALVEAFRGGWATVEHYDELADMRDLMAIAATERNDRIALAFCDMAMEILVAIRDHYAAAKRMAATVEEIKGLQEFVTAYRDFWMRQPESLHLKARAELEKARKSNVTVVEL